MAAGRSLQLGNKEKSAALELDSVQMLASSFILGLKASLSQTQNSGFRLILNWTFCSCQNMWVSSRPLYVFTFAPYKWAIRSFKETLQNADSTRYVLDEHLSLNVSCLYSQIRTGNYIFAKIEFSG